MKLHLLPILFVLTACGENETTHGNDNKGGTPLAPIQPPISTRISANTTTTTPQALTDDKLSQLWSEALSLENRNESNIACFALLRKAIKESPAQLALLIRETRPGLFRESLLAEIGSKASAVSISSLIDQIGSELDDKEWSNLSVGFRIQEREPGRNKDAFLSARNETNSKLLKYKFDLVLASTIKSLQDLSFAEQLTATLTEDTYGVAETAFREIGRQSPETLWNEASGYTSVAQSEARKAALMGMTQNSFQKTADFVLSQSADPTIKPLANYIVEKWLSADPLEASAWVSANGNKELYITVSEFCQGRGDFEAAKIWRAKAR